MSHPDNMSYDHDAETKGQEDLDGNRPEPARDTTGVPLVHPPAPYPLDEAMAEAHSHDPDAIAAIIAGCKPTKPSSDVDLDTPEWARPPAQPASQRSAAATQSRTADPAIDVAKDLDGAPQRPSAQPHGHAKDSNAQPSDLASHGAEIIPKEDSGALLIEDCQHPPPVARDVTEINVPQTLAEKLQVLPPWQARYVLALMELGGNIALACQRCSVSRASVNAALASPNSEFAMACHDATDHSTDLMEAAIYRGGSIGDVQPVYQKGLIVGYKRVRNTTDAELLMRLRGRLTDEGPAGSAKPGTRPPVAASQVPEIVAATLATLFAARAAQQQVGR